MIEHETIVEQLNYAGGNSMQRIFICSLLQLCVPFRHSLYLSAAFREWVSLRGIHTTSIYLYHRKIDDYSLLLHYKLWHIIRKMI